LYPECRTIAISIDELDPIVLRDDPGLDHAADILHGERPAGQTTSSAR
jgi:hypothetical protein